jgi:hypothetical protein
MTRAERESVGDDEKARIAINRGGWRILALAAVVLTVAAIAALLAQDGLFDSKTHTRPDGLTTLALVLAVLAFIVQIIVFALQTATGARAVQRSEELSHEAQKTLSKIETTSDATQKTLVSQFNRLLDFVVGPQASPIESSGGDAPQGDEEAEPETLLSEEGTAGEADPSQPATVAEVRQIVADAFTTRPTRPVFDLPVRAGRVKDDAVLDELTSWPEREEAEQSVAVLRRLSPLAIIQVRRLRDDEIKQRRGRRAIGLRSPPNPLADVKEMLDAGLIEREGDRLRLTEQGRRVSRALPGGKPQHGRPRWWEEVIAPLLEAPRGV